jgi:sulfhydrogenase subunit alpha
MSKIINIDHLYRVEGHGGITIELDNGDVKNIKANIFEGSRFFEVLLQGKYYDELPAIIARVCAICTTAHTLASINAVENAFNIKVSQRTKLLRELLNYAGIIESHALHIFFLVLPDILGFPSAIKMAAEYPEEVKKALRIKKLGNTLQELVGGRAIHPVNPIIGGFAKMPDKAQFKDLKKDLQEGLEESCSITKLFLDYKCPTFQKSPTIYAALSQDGKYSFVGDKIKNTLDKKVRDIKDFREICNEKVVSHSTAKQSLYSNKPFMVGAQARIIINGDKLTGLAKELKEELFDESSVDNIFCNNIAQMIELVHAISEASTLVNKLIELKEEEPSLPEVDVKACSGVGAVEAPRGSLYHHYQFDEEGKCIDADVITPTAQNLANLEKDIKVSVERLIKNPEEDLKHKLQMVARAYDPCISCATHFIELKAR